MRVSVKVEDRASELFRELAERELPEARRDLVRDAMREALSQVVRLNPVETGRSRAAWVRTLEQMGGEAPQGWRGPRANGAAIAEGSGAAAVEQADEESLTTAAATSSVKYVRYLEYGTSKMGAFAMVRRALLGVQQQVGRSFRFPRR